MLNIVGPTGKRLRVTERAYKEVYKEQGYQTVSGKANVKQIKEAEERAEEATDYSLQTEASLKRVKNEKLMSFLDGKGVVYQEDASKEDLISLVKG